LARTPEGAALTRVHQARQDSLAAAVLRDLLALWTSIIDPGDLSTFQRFAELAATMIGLRRRDSAGLAAAYYEQFRRTEEVEGGPTVVLAAPLAADAVQGAVRAAGLAGFTNGRRAGQTPEQAARNGFVRAGGTATRLVLDGGRRTLVDSIARDRQALGWLRVTDADPCAFCRVLASRGPEYKSRESAHFQAHDHDRCTPEPFYQGSQMPALSQGFRAEYAAAQRWARENGTSDTSQKNYAINNLRRYLASRS
jgi:hypothetical protein